jgi:membrane associated rhomboid family serine protease
VQYFVEHPYLMPPDALEPLLGPDWEAQRALLLQMREDAGQSTRMIPDFMRDQQQEELDGLVAEGLAARNEHPFFKWGLVTGEASLAGAFGYMFLHGGWMHLLGNMLLLFLTGSFIEDRWGRPVYLTFYLLAGLAAAGLFMSRFPDLATPLVGASGAVAGCMGAFLVRFWRAKLRYLVWFVVFGFTFSAPAWLMLPLWFAGEFLMARLTEAANPMGGAGVAYWAHVGGFGFGVLVALGMRAVRFEERWMDSVVDRKIGVVSNDGVEAAMTLMEAGEHEQAYDMLSREVKRDPRNREAAQALWDVAGVLGRAAQAAPGMLRLIREEVRAGETDLAVQHWIEFAQRAERLPVDPALALRLAPDLANQDKEPLAADVIDRALDSPDALPGVALRLARLARDLDARVCARAARIAAGSPVPAEATEAKLLLETVGASLEEPEPHDLEAGSALDLGTVAGADDGPLPELATSAARGAGAEAPEYDGSGTSFDSLDLESGSDVGGSASAAAADASPAPAEPQAAEAPGAGPDAELAGLDLSDADLSDEELAGIADIDLDGLDLGSEVAGPITEDAPPPPLAEPAEPAAPEAASDPALDPAQMGVEPGTFDPSALEMEVRPGSAASNPALEDFGAISLDPEPAPAPAPAPPRPLRIMDAVPVRLRDDALSLEVDGRGKTRLRFERIEALAAGAVRGIGSRPVLVVDLALNWNDAAGRPLQVVRLRSDRFDPRRLVEGAEKPLDALCRLVETLLDATGAAPLPDRDTVCGRPRFPVHESLEAYERDALGGVGS